VEVVAMDAWMDEVDVVVIGGGAAGLSGALMLARARRSVVVIDGWEVRDRAVGVLASGPMSVHQALLFRQLTPDVAFFSHTLPPTASSSPLAESRSSTARWPRWRSPTTD
jgi:2-polyprenyl-6-methoxyphenol hydroxylase-like FAD-dependent oxidoreductase